MSRRLVEAATRFLDRGVTRRSFLSNVALVGSALMTAPLDFVLRPMSAYVAVCGPYAECAHGYTVFCCTVNRGINRCPPGMFVGGWWRADGSTYCCDANGNPSSRYYIDCHPTCTCSCGSGNFCSSSCTACSCKCNDTGCDRRRVCCNNFRYGQCHTEISCSGPVACRVVTCVPPHTLFDDCGSTLRIDNQTSQQTAPCLSGPC